MKNVGGKRNKRKSKTKAKKYPQSAADIDFNLVLVQAFPRDLPGQQFPDDNGKGIYVGFHQNLGFNGDEDAVGEYLRGGVAG